LKDLHAFDASGLLRSLTVSREGRAVGNAVSNRYGKGFLSVRVRATQQPIRRALETAIARAVNLTPFVTGNIGRSAAL